MSASPLSVFARRPRRHRLGPGPAVPYGRIFGPLLLITAWTISSATGLSDPHVLPSPWTVAAAARELVADGRLQDNLAISCQRALEGLAIGVTVALAISLFAGLTRIGEYTFDGVVEIKRALPSLALIPLLMLWFGIGETIKIAVIAISAFAPVYVQTHAALRDIDMRFVELSETLRVTKLDFLRHVVLPGALPGFFLGLRFAVNAALLALVVVEQVNATSGIGYMINLAGTYGQTDVVLVGLVVYALLGFAADSAVRMIQRRVLSWRRTLAR